MAESSRHTLAAGDRSVGTDGRGPDLCLMRLDIIRIITSYRTATGDESLEQLRTIVDSGWDINKVLDIQLSNNWVQSTALNEAARQGWTDAVKMLLQAGAKCNTVSVLESPLMLALQQYHEHTPDLIELLLKHDADPNYHNGTIKTFCNQWVRYTPLNEAIRQGRTDAVRLLLEAGAKCQTAGVLDNPLMLALQRYDEHTLDLLKLLLKHGANPNYHDGTIKTIPLLKVIFYDMHHEDSMKIVELLLEYGADPNVSNGRPHESKEGTYSAALDNPFDEFSALFRILLHFGLDVNHNAFERSDFASRLLHGMISKYSCWGPYIFPQETFDLFFMHGGNIDMDDVQLGRALEYNIGRSGHSNNARWLIRHGAHTSPIRVALLKGHFNAYYTEQFPRIPETPLILLQAGMRLPAGAPSILSNMGIAISTWLQDGTREASDIHSTIEPMWHELDNAEKGGPQMIHCRRLIYPEYLNQQMADLQEFSDEFLDVYPKDSYDEEIRGKGQRLQELLDQIHAMVEFLSQPQSLLWYSRRCVRENLVSLQPSVVKTLQGPDILKRYTLCHEV